MPKCVFVTGASSGIGLAILNDLAGKGFRVVGSTRSLLRNCNLVQDLKAQYGDCAQFVEMDVDDDVSVEGGVKKAYEFLGDIDFLICNTGRGSLGSLEEHPLEEGRKLFETNVFGTLRVLKKIIPNMRKRRSGTIIFVGSIGGLVGIPFQSHYSATKFAIEAYAECLRQELRSFGIKVSVVRPGDIKTKFNESTKKYESPNSPYANNLSKFWESTLEIEKHAPEASFVSRKIGKIIKKATIKEGYVVADWKTLLAMKINRLIPQNVKEKLVRRYYGIDGDDKPEVC
ncbi:MAG: SDR family oxidoreductase [Elusimicrobia bacterium]|nr:SDR family oxidoreductase [Elusimicrobiota bacterium]